MLIRAEVLAADAAVLRARLPEDTLHVSAAGGKGLILCRERNSVGWTAPCGDAGDSLSQLLTVFIFRYSFGLHALTVYKVISCKVLSRHNEYASFLSVKG
jgi:hypothetical protein